MTSIDQLTTPAALVDETTAYASIVERLRTAGRLDRLFIDGEWVVPKTQTRTSVVDPSTEEPVVEIALGSAEDVDWQWCGAARFQDMVRKPRRSRGLFLDRIHALILERAEVFAQAISLEMGAAISIARSAQVPFAAAHIRVARECRRYPFLTIQGTRRSCVSPSASAASSRRGTGRSTRSPRRSAAAFAAGCTVVLKPSELSPLSALLFAQVMHDAGVPPGVFNLVNGTGRKWAQRWQRIPTST